MGIATIQQVKATTLNVVGVSTLGNLEVGTGSTTYTNGLIVSKQGAEFQGVVTASSFSGETLKSRAYVHGTTGSLAVNATNNLSIIGHKSYALLNVGVSTAAWVRLYTDSDSREYNYANRIGTVGIGYHKPIKGLPKIKVLYNPTLEYANGKTKTYEKEDFIVSVFDEASYETLFLYTDIEKKKIFEFIDNLLQKTGKIGEYDQKI